MWNIWHCKKNVVNCFAKVLIYLRTFWEGKRIRERDSFEILYKGYLLSIVKIKRERENERVKREERDRERKKIKRERESR